MSFAFMLLRGLDESTTFVQIGLSVSKVLWSVSRTDIHAPKPSHTSWEESMFSASTCTGSSSHLC